MKTKKWTITLVVKVDVTAKTIYDATQFAKQFDYTQRMDCIENTVTDITFIKVRPKTKR